MEKYNDKIKDLGKVAFIHISLDNDEDAAEEWAAKEGFPWLTVPNDKMERSGLDAYKTTNGVPEYHLIDGEGNTIVEGSPGPTASFAKIAEIAAEEEE